MFYLSSTFFFWNSMRWQITSGSTNRNQATLTTPYHANITKNYFCPFFSNEPNARERTPLKCLAIGTFHADPHSGNLCVHNHNQLVFLDFGLCATIDEQSRMAMTAAIVHLLAGDFDTLVSVDAKRLGFLLNIWIPLNFNLC